MHSPLPVSIQNAQKEAMETTAMRHVAPAVDLRTRATLSTELVHVLMTTGKHQCVQVRYVSLVYMIVMMLMMLMMMRTSLMCDDV